MPVEVTDKYIRVRVKDPGTFEEGSFRTITLSAEQGIKAIVGRPAGETKTTVQSYLFDKEKWDKDRAEAWVAEHRESKSALAEMLILEAYEVAAEPLDPPAPLANLSCKALSSDQHGATVGGYLLLWGDPKRRDLQQQFFTKTSELWLDKYPVVPALFHHGLDPAVGANVIGRRLKAQADDVGVWVKHWIDKSNQFWNMVEPLLEAERLYYSPGSANHLVRIDAKSGEILAFPVIEDTLTAIPAQPRLRLHPVEHIKAAYESANLALPELGEDSAETLSLARAEAEALRLTIDLELAKLRLNT